LTGKHRLGVVLLSETSQATRPKQSGAAPQTWRHFTKGSAPYDAFTDIANASEAKVSHEARVTFANRSGHVPWHGSLSPSRTRTHVSWPRFYPDVTIPLVLLETPWDNITATPYRLGGAHPRLRAHPSQSVHAHPSLARPHE
jgi:hypothetical protein